MPSRRSPILASRSWLPSPMLAPRPPRPLNRRTVHEDLVPCCKPACRCRRCDGGRPNPAAPPKPNPTPTAAVAAQGRGPKPALKPELAKACLLHWLRQPCLPSLPSLGPIAARSRASPLPNGGCGLRT
jgi:hypothetical protein